MAGNVWTGLFQGYLAGKEQKTKNEDRQFEREMATAQNQRAEETMKLRQEEHDWTKEQHLQNMVILNIQAAEATKEEDKQKIVRAHSRELAKAMRLPPEAGDWALLDAYKEIQKYNYDIDRAKAAISASNAARQSSLQEMQMRKDNALLEKLVKAHAAGADVDPRLIDQVMNLPPGSMRAPLGHGELDRALAELAAAKTIYDMTPKPTAAQTKAVNTSADRVLSLVDPNYKPDGQIDFGDSAAGVEALNQKVKILTQVLGSQYVPNEMSGQGVSEGNAGNVQEIMRLLRSLALGNQTIPDYMQEVVTQSAKDGVDITTPVGEFSKKNGRLPTKEETLAIAEQAYAKQPAAKGKAPAGQEQSFLDTVRQNMGGELLRGFLSGQPNVATDVASSLGRPFDFGGQQPESPYSGMSGQDPAGLNVLLRLIRSLAAQRGNPEISGATR